MKKERLIPPGYHQVTITLALLSNWSQFTDRRGWESPEEIKRSAFLERK